MGTGFLIMINYIYNQMYYLQELGILLGGCLTVKNLVWIFLGSLQLSAIEEVGICFALN